MEGRNIKFYKNHSICSEVVPHTNRNFATASNL